MFTYVFPLNLKNTPYSKTCQKHPMIFEMKWHFTAKWKNFVNTSRYTPCPWEFIRIITVQIWHFVGDYHVVQYTPADTMERVS